MSMWPPPPYVLAFGGVTLFSIGFGSMVALSVKASTSRFTFLGKYKAYLGDLIKPLFLDTTPKDIIVAQAAGLALSVIGYALLGDWRFSLLTLASIVGPSLYLKKERSNRILKIEEQLNGWMMSLANLLRASGSVTDAVMTTSDLIRPPLKQEVDLMIKELQVGRSIEDGLTSMAKRIESELLSIVVTTMIIAKSTGGELPVLLERMAASFREMHRLDGVMRTQTAQGRMQLWALGLGPPGLAYILTNSQPDYFDAALEDMSGIIVFGIAVACWLAAIFIAKKILTIDY